MKRSLVLTVSLSLAAALLYASLGFAQATAPSFKRATPRSVSLTVTPKRDRTRPFRFTSTGRVNVPRRYCSVAESQNPGNRCVPLICPPGAVDAQYCIRPGLGAICTGKVNVRFQRRRTTISSRSVKLRPNCTYRSRVTFNIRVVTRRGSFRVRARFQGNSILAPKTSPTRTVRAG